MDDEIDIVEEEPVVEATTPTDAIANAQKEAEAIIAKAKEDANAITEDADSAAKKIEAKAKAKAKTIADKAKTTVSGKVKVVVETPKDIVATGGEYKAVRKCYFGIQLYEKGRILHTTKGDVIPRHFKKVVRMVEVTEDEE